MYVSAIVLQYSLFVYYCSLFCSLGEYVQCVTYFGTCIHIMYKCGFRFLGDYVHFCERF